MIKTIQTKDKYLRTWTCDNKKVITITERTGTTTNGNGKYEVQIFENERYLNTYSISNVGVIHSDLRDIAESVIRHLYKEYE